MGKGVKINFSMAFLTGYLMTSLVCLAQEPSFSNPTDSANLKIEVSGEIKDFSTHFQSMNTRSRNPFELPLEAISKDVDLRISLFSEDPTFHGPIETIQWTEDKNFPSHSDLMELPGIDYPGHYVVDVYPSHTGEPYLNLSFSIQHGNSKKYLRSVLVKIKHGSWNDYYAGNLVILEPRKEDYPFAISEALVYLNGVCNSYLFPVIKSAEKHGYIINQKLTRTRQTQINSEITKKSFLRKMIREQNPKVEYHLQGDCLTEKVSELDFDVPAFFWRKISDSGT